MGRILKHLTLSCLIIMSFSMAAQSKNVDLSENWQVLREYRGETAPGENQKWLDLKETLTRRYRLEHPYEPGMEIWLKNSFEVPEVLRKERFLVLSIGNRRILGDVFINGHNLEDIGKIQWLGGKPEGFKKIVKSDPRGNTFGHFVNLIRENQHWDVPGLYLVKPEMLKDGANTVTCQAWEADAYNEYLNKVGLRSPKITDLFFPISYSQPFGETGAEAVLKLRHRVPMPAKLTMNIEVLDFLGKVLRKKERIIDYAGKDLIIPIKPESGDDYKAIVTFSWNGERTEALWAYYTPRLKVGKERQSFSLRGVWKYRGISQSQKKLFPIPQDDWRLTYVPGRVVNAHTLPHWKGRHRCYLTKNFKVPSELNAKRLILRLGTIVIKGDIYLNEKLLGETSIHDSPVEYDVTETVDRKGKNEICIILTDWSVFLKEGSPIPPDGQEQAPRTSSLTGDAIRIRLGLQGYVELLAAPDVRIKRIWAIPSVKNNKLTVKTWIENHNGSDATVNVKYLAEDKDGKKFELNGGEVKIPAKSVFTLESVKYDANLPLWSLDKPNLCGLTVSLIQNDKTLDCDSVRFGFRDITKRGRDILVNGKKVHLRGASDAFKDYYYPKDAGSMAYMTKQSKKRGFNINRIQGMIKVPTILWDIYDEIGYFANAESSLDDMSRARVAYGDPRLHDNGIKEFKSFILENFNHPSILTWNYGNEVFYAQMTKNKLLEAGFRKVVKAVKAFDPTRLVTQDGASDFEGADTYNPHYPRFQPLTNELYFLYHPINHNGYTKEQAALEAKKGRGNYPVRSLVRPWDGKNPMISGEFSWLHEDMKPGESYDIFGEAAIKPGPTRYIEGHPSIQLMAAFGLERELNFKGLRIGGIAACVAHRIPLLSTRYARQVIATFMKLNSRFMAGKDFEREIIVFNDSGEKRKLKVELIWRDGDKELGRLEKDVELESASEARFSFTIPGIKTDKTKEIFAELSVDGEGVPRFVDKQKWTIFPDISKSRKWKAKIAVFDPNNTLDGLFNQFDVEVKKIDDFNNLEGIDLLVLGEEIGPEILKRKSDKVQEFVKNGGSALIMRQSEFGDFLPFDLTNYRFYESVTCQNIDTYSGLSVVHAKTHPLFKNMLPDDFKSWGGDEMELVHSAAYKAPASGNMRVLSGLLPKYATLIEANYGKGRYLVNSLELTPVKVKNEPAVTKFLANILEFAENPPPAPGETLVLAGEEGPTLAALKGKTRLLADYFNTPPKSLDKYSLIILCDWDKNSPSEAFASTLREYLLKGGKVLVESPGEKMRQWLEKLIEKKINVKKHIAQRVVKRVVHPLMSGLADGDLAWIKGGRKWAFNSKKETENDILRSIVIPEGALALTHPTALSVLDVGKGQLLLNQIRWPHAGGERGKRLQLALLTNLGSELEHYKEKVVEDRSEFETCLTFTPIDMAKVCNRARSDNAPNDGLGGWIDLGPTDLRMIPTGPQYMRNGVLFDIVNERKNEGKGCVMLSPSKTASTAPPATKELAVESEAIPVGKTADYLFFLHTAAYQAEPEKTPVLAYEIRYEGFANMIPGMDFTEFVAKVPVEIEVGIQDWITGKNPPVIPYAWRGKVGPKEDLKGHLYSMKWKNPKPDKKIESIRIIGLEAKCIPIVLAITIGNKTENMLPGGDVAKVAPCGAIVTKGVSKPAYPKQEKTWHGGWVGNFWKKFSSGEICSGTIPGSEEDIAMHIKTTAGPPSGQMWLKNRVSLKPGATYAVSMKYRALNQALGSVALQVRKKVIPSDITVDCSKYKSNNPVEQLKMDYYDKYLKVHSTNPSYRFKLPTTSKNEWKFLNLRFHVLKPVDERVFHIQYQNRGERPEDIFYFKDIKLWKIAD